jgi:hypothetical protein
MIEVIDNQNNNNDQNINDNSNTDYILVEEVLDEKNFLININNKLVDFYDNCTNTWVEAFVVYIQKLNINDIRNNENNKKIEGIESLKFNRIILRLLNTYDYRSITDLYNHVCTRILPYHTFTYNNENYNVNNRVEYIGINPKIKVVITKIINDNEYRISYVDDEKIDHHLIIQSNMIQECTNDDQFSHHQHMIFYIHYH